MGVNQLPEQLADFASRSLLAIGAFALGYVLVHYVLTRLVQRLLRQSGVDEVFVRYSTNITSVFLKLFVALLALGVLGVNTGLLMAVLVGAILALIAATQGWLQDGAAGVLMLFTEPFKLNDLVRIAGVEGRVQQIGFLTTTLHTSDNLVLILPNRTVASNVITNLHAQAERRIELEVKISYDDDIREAVDILRDVVTSDGRVLSEPEPVIAVAELGTHSIKLHVRPWVKQEDFSDTRYDLREKIRYALAANNMSIAYPHLKVHADAEGTS